MNDTTRSFESSTPQGRTVSVVADEYSWIPTMDLLERANVDFKVFDALTGLAVDVRPYYSHWKYQS